MSRSQYFSWFKRCCKRSQASSKEGSKVRQAGLGVCWEETGFKAVWEEGKVGFEVSVEVVQGRHFASSIFMDGYVH